MIEALFFLVRVALAIMWITAAVAKLRNQKTASQAVVDFDLMPPRIARGAAYILPWGEMLLGGLLFAGIFTSYAALTSFVLLLVFSVAIGVNLSRGRSVSCQCFGSMSKSPLSVWSLVRNGFLGSLFVALAWYNLKNNPAHGLQSWRLFLTFVVTQKNDVPAVLLLLFSGIMVRELLANFYSMMFAMAHSQDGPMRGTIEDKAVRRLRLKRTL